MLGFPITVLAKSETIVDKIFVENGFVRFDTGDKNFHDTFTQAGIKTSPFNSEKIYRKDDRLYIFDGWEADCLGRKADHPKYIRAIDVTDLVV